MGISFLIRDKLSNILRGNKGVAFIEFALCVPFLLVLFFGAIEVSRYFLATQKVEKTIDLLSDAFAQADDSSTTENLTAVRVNALLSMVPSLMNPYEFNPAARPSRGIVIITDITQPLDATQGPVINWQACGGGTLAHASIVGTSSGDKAAPNNATLPASFTMQPGEEVIVGEIYYNFSPILVQDIISDIPMQRIVYFTPRVGSLSDYNSKC